MLSNLARAAVLLLALVAQGASARVAAFALSPDQKATAFLKRTPYVLRVVGGDMDMSVAIDGIGVEHPDPSPELSWSPDGRFVAMSYILDSDTSAVLVVDVQAGKIVWEHDTPKAAWLGEGHSLLVVPHYDVGVEQAEPGLIRLDAQTLKEQRIATDHFFVGEIDAGVNHIVARVVRKTQDAPDYGLIYLDLGSAQAIILE